MFNNNFKGKHAKHGKCNTTIKQTSMASAARRQIIGGGAPTTKKGALGLAYIHSWSHRHNYIINILD